MHHDCPLIARGAKFILLAALAFCISNFAEPASAADVAASVAFTGEKTSWHGFDRYDFMMDEQTLTITPIKAQDDEKDGIRHNVQGQRRCVIVVPKAAAPGNPWSWRGCYWDHQPQTEVELLKRGFHIAYVESSATLKPGPTWEAWYDFLTAKHGLSPKPAFVGMSRGGEYAYTWSTTHPDKVACIYADNPGGNPEILMKLGELATRDVPVLHVCGSIDPILGKFTLTMENIYQQFGGRITVMIKEGRGHHPHSLRDPKPIADWMEQNAKPVEVAKPAFVGVKFTRTSFYSLTNWYRDFPKEGTYIACRGPGFTECYDRYAFDLPGVEGALNVIAPKTPAPGTPWVFRADYLTHDAAVDLALLAKGFHIVTGPVPYNADGPQIAHWNTVYEHLVKNGFSSKPVMEGNGGAAGEAYAWAIANPDKVSCIYAVNAVMHSTLAKTQPLDNLTALAKAGVPLLHVSGSLDPWLAANTRVVEKRYEELGGKITIIINEGEGHYPLAPKDTKPVVDFITANSTVSKSEPSAARAGGYGFDKTMPREVLENYLARSITMEGLLNGRGDLKDNIRMLKEAGAKFIGRSICLWGGEANLLRNFERAREQVPMVHAVDPEMILEACIFEIVSMQVEQVPVPDWAFEALGQPVEKRNFRYADMIYPEKQRRNWGANASVPDVSRPETKLWFYFLAKSYIDLGFEAIHWGQVEIMNRNDRSNASWSEVLALARAYAATHARRHMVVCDAHVPSGGLVHAGRLLLDFHAFPLRIMETPEKPEEAILKVGYADAIYGHSKGGPTFSGWTCDHLPYLVELDNYGVSKHPGKTNDPGQTLWVWGYDEISWFARQPQGYRSNWLNYAWSWVRKTDTNGWLQMPGSRTATLPLDHRRWYFANDPSPAVPDGRGDEAAIRAVWTADAPKSVSRASMPSSP